MENVNRTVNYNRVVVFLTSKCAVWFGSIIIWKNLQTNRELSKAGHRLNLAPLRFRVNAATERHKHTQVDFLWITQRFRKIAVFPINSERLDASVFTPMLPATKRRSRTCATRATDVIFERKHCSRRRRHTQVELSSSRKCADKTQTIARKRWHGARKRKRWNVVDLWPA